MGTDAPARYCVKSEVVSMYKSTMFFILRRGGASWTPLVARYSFKVAWFYEFQGNADKALRHYRVAYATLSTLASSFQGTDHARTSKIPFSREFRDPCGQVKGVADYANFKICRLTLKQNKIKEAATQMQTHLWYFRDTATNDVPHQHWGWLSRQHVIFAQLIAHHSTANPSPDNNLAALIDDIPHNQHKTCNIQGGDASSVSIQGLDRFDVSVSGDSVKSVTPEVQMAALVFCGTSKEPSAASIHPTLSYCRPSEAVNLPWKLDCHEVLAYAEPIYHYAAAAAYAVYNCAIIRVLSTPI